MPDYSVYIAPVKRTSIFLLVILVLLLFFQPSYVFSYYGLTKVDWSNVNTYWLIIGGFVGVFLLYNLIPGLYLGNEYYKYDKLSYNKIKNISLHKFKKSISKADCISSYTDGKWIPGAIHADYWYYEVYLKNEENYKVSNFLAVELNLLEYVDEEPNHVYTLFPSIKYEDDLTLKEKEKTFQPSESLINRFEKRYRTYSEESLIEIINNNGYRTEAKIAAKNLLEEKKA